MLKLAFCTCARTSVRASDRASDRLLWLEMLGDRDEIAQLEDRNKAWS